MSQRNLRRERVLMVIGSSLMVMPTNMLKRIENQKNLSLVGSGVLPGKGGVGRMSGVCKEVSSCRLSLQQTGSP